MQWNSGLVRLLLMLFTHENDFNAHAENISRQVFPAVSPGVIKAVIATESGFRVRAYLEEAGGDGSIGLMQLRLTTANGLGYAGTKEQLFDPGANVYYGTKLLDQLLRRVHGDTVGPPDWEAVYSAYNGGYRPALGFGVRVTKPTRICLRKDPVTKRCVKFFDAKPGEFGNQPNVDRFARMLDYYHKTDGGGKGMGALLIPLALIIGGRLLKGG